MSTLGFVKVGSPDCGGGQTVLSSDAEIKIVQSSPLGRDDHHIGQISTREAQSLA